MRTPRVLVLLLAAALPALPVRPGRTDTYAIVLTEPPVGKRLSRPMKIPAVRARADVSEIRALAQTVEQTQRPIRDTVARMGLPVVGSTKHLLNAVFVQATTEQAQRLRGMAGVRGVVRMQRYKLALNAAADLISAPAAWNSLGGIGNAGAGVIIGVLDTGMDPNNAALQDSTLTPPAGFPKATTANLPFTNNKIIVARSYVCPAGTIDPATSRPDDCSPNDRSGHGTFVGAMVAGRQISTPGPTITGIAPKAFLANYKISGSTDLNDLPRQDWILMAMDDAVSDGVDILNVSLGSIAMFAPDDTGFVCSSNPQAVCDPLAEAVAVATENFGVVVVTAAGNDGDRGKTVPTLNTISSPATSSDAIAVGATTNSRKLTSTLRGGPGSPGSLASVPALFGNGPRPAAPLTAPIRSVDTLGDDGTACKALPAGSLNGSAALIQRGACDFADKVSNAQAAGAVAVVVYNSAGNNAPFTMTGLVNATIPAVMVGNTAGAALRDYSRSAGASVTLDPQLVAQPTTPDQVAVFSSRGPSIDIDIKPDLVAPGVDIFSTTQKLDPNGAEYDPTGFTTLEGTSFSTALVTGAAALVIQANPSFDAFDIKSALVNTASPNVLDNGQQARETAIGAGKLNVQAAIKPGATVDPVSADFGLLARNADLPVSGTIVLTNVGTASDTFRLDVQQRDPDSNARVTINNGSSASVTLGVNQSLRVPVALTGSLPRPGLYEGVIRVQGSATNLRIVYHYGVAGTPPPQAANIFAITGDGVIGTPSQPLPDLLIFKLIDQFGFPLRNTSVLFRIVQGSGKIVQADSTTDRYGIAAADVDLGPELGEQIFTATAAGLTVNFVTAARAKPVIGDGGVVNAASFAGGQKVAPGSIISIFGQNLAETILSAIRLPLPLVLGRVSVSFDQPDAGLSVPGRIFYVSPNQMNLQVPWEFAGQTFAMIKVRIGNTVSAVYRLVLSDYGPGVFEFNLGGQRLGVITHPDGQVVTPSNPARRGETVIVYATGVGPVDQPQASGEAAGVQPVANTKQLPTVTVGSSPAQVLFSGLTPFLVGLNQLNVTIPADAPTGVQPLAITSNGVPANTVNVPIQ